MGDDDFYEDDEPIEALREAWQRGEVGETHGPRALSEHDYALIRDAVHGWDDAAATAVETKEVDTSGWFAPPGTLVSLAGTAVMATTETSPPARV